MSRNPDKRLSRALARPGTELQRRSPRASRRTRSSRSRRQRCRRSSRTSGGLSVTPTRTACERLDPTIFELPVEKMRDGYYSDAYFNHTRAALLYDDRRPRRRHPGFQRRHAMLGGLDEAIAILKLCSHDWDGLVVHALHDGDRVEPWETVMTIEGDYTAFAHLETVVLGTLARRTLIATNTARVVEAANGKPIIFMPARHDHHACRPGRVRGVRRRCRARRRDRCHLGRAGVVVGWAGRRHGAHALIARVAGTRSSPRRSSRSGRPASRNHCPRRLRERLGAHRARRRLGARPALWGVRLDTSSQLVDRSLWGELGDFDPRGVNERLVRKAREGPRRDGFERVRIVASGGFTVEKIEQFERSGVRSTRTGSARRSSAARTTSRPTSS